MPRGALGGGAAGTDDTRASDARMAMLSAVASAVALNRALPLRMTARADFMPSSTYEWRGHSCSFVKAGEGPPVVLIHGFAGSAYNCWRSTLPALISAVWFPIPNNRRSRARNEPRLGG